MKNRTGNIVLHSVLMVCSQLKYYLQFASQFKKYVVEKKSTEGVWWWELE